MQLVSLSTLVYALLLCAMSCPSLVITSAWVGDDLDLVITTEDPTNPTTESTTPALPCGGKCDAINGSYCTAEGICVCREGYVPHTSEEGDCSESAVFSCLPHVSTFYSTCLVDAQCTAGIGEKAVCNLYRGDSGQCGCVSGYVQVQKDDWEWGKWTYSCEPTRDLGESCTNYQQCRSTPFADCEAGRCNCRYGRVADDTKTLCVQKATRIGAKCDQTNQICSNLENSECVGGGEKTCECKQGFEKNEGGTQCIPVIPYLNIECRETNECQGQGKICAFSGDQDKTTCQCLPDHVQHEQGCLPIRYKIQDSCQQNVQCTSGPLGSSAECRRTCDYCSTFECACQHDAILGSDGRCHPKVTRLGGECKVQEQCVIGKHSDASRYECGFNFTTGHLHCQCSPGFVQYGETTCHSQRFFGDMCQSQEECKASIDERAECNGSCGCSQGFVISADGRSCLMAGLQAGDKCQESIQCMTMHIEARKGIEREKDGICDVRTNTCRDIRDI